MPPRPIHRWRSLWLGILVIASLGWAWWDSTHWWTQLSYGRWNLIHSAAGISINYSGPRSPMILLSQWQRQPLTTRIEGRWPGLARDDGYWRPALFEAPGFFRGNGQEGRLFSVEGLLGDSLLPRNAAGAHFEDQIWANSPGSLALYLPYWLLILAFLLPWSAFLLWRSRRINRIPTGTAGSAEPPARSST